MSIYIFSSGRSIQVELFSINITLMGNGTSEVVFDILLTNKSKEAISNIVIMYPHKLFHVKIVNEELKVFPITIFEDISYDFLNESSINNKLYPNLGNIGFKSDYREDYTSLVLNLPDPLRPYSDISYNGRISNFNQIKPFNEFNSLQWKILEDLNLSAFTCVLKLPIMQEEARWFRWRINRHLSSVNRMVKKKNFFDAFDKESFFLYEIRDPNNIRDQFEKKILTYIKMCEPHNNNTRLTLYNEAQAIYNKIFKDGINIKETNTFFPNYRINLYPFRYKEIYNLVFTGDIKLVGSSPNYIQYSINKNSKKGPSLTGEYCYSWLAGARNVELYNNGYFAISLSAKKVNKFIKLLPLISLLLAIIAIIISIFMS